MMRPLGPYIIWTTLLTKFHDDWTINVDYHIRKNAPPPGGQVFQQTRTIFEHIQDIIRTKVLTKFHENQTINVTCKVITRKNALPPDGHVFQPTGTICELIQYIIGTNLLSKFHEDRTINLESRVLTRFYYSHIRKNAMPPLTAMFFNQLEPFLNSSNISLGQFF
ncbi:hypothetical protein DPMN_109508 [Dreissena polymorpha]|uniref:Uncharacterized protein n=1 Tax=Dreissena polymorpha TaxID=45954 RepID=A0A9D4KAF5_DREPO|nr:hypothetical protein DPMN_109508 [Dreissena polymorpha]